MKLIFLIAVALFSSCEESPSSNVFCEVHGVEMERFSVKITYGLLIPASNNQYEYEEEKALYFPNCELFLSGDCCITAESPSHEYDYLCHSCIEMKENWIPLIYRINRRIRDKGIKEEASPDKDVQTINESDFFEER